MFREYARTPSKTFMPPKLSQIDINLLPILDALLQERSVSRAAVRVGRSQPAISHALRRLRHLLQDELLVRVGQRYELTAEAQALADPLHVLLQQLSDVLAARPTFDPQHAEREFSIAATDYVAGTILRSAIQKLAVEAPRVRFNISEATGGDVVAEIRSGHQHIAIFPKELRPIASDFHSEVLARDTWCCAAWSGNTAIGSRLTQETFETLPHVVELFSPSVEQGYPGAFLASLGVRRRPIVRTSYILLAPFLLQGTSALAVLPRRLADWFCEAADLRIFPVPFELPDFIIEMCWSARYTTDPAHMWLRSELKDAAAGL